MENQKKHAMIRFPVILLAVSAILLSALPSDALVEVPLPSGETTLDVYYSIDDSVVVKTGGTLNLLDGGSVNGVFGIGIEDGGTLNIYGGYISSDVYIASGSEVNIKGGDIGGGFWDIAVEGQADITVFGTDFSVTNGIIDTLGTFFTPYANSICTLKGKYGGDAGDIDLLFYVYFSDIRINLAPPAPEVIELLIDIKPGGEQNSINLKSRGVVPVAVLTTDSICAEMIDPDTVEFAGAIPEHWSFEDVDDDGDDDIIFHFRTQELDIDQNSTEATLTARLLTQEEVFGTDEIRVVPSKK